MKNLNRAANFLIGAFDQTGSLGNMVLLLAMAASSVLFCSYAGAATVDVALNGNINSAIETVHADGGGSVVLAAGTWTINSSIDMLSNVTLTGAGNPNTTLDATGGFNVIQETADGESNMAVKNMKIVGVASNTSSNGVYIDSTSTYNTNITVSGVQVEDCGGIGVQLKRCNTFQITNCNLHNNGITDLYHNCYCYDVNNGSITDCQCNDSPNGSGIHLNTDANGGTCDNVTISGCTCSGNGQDGMDIMGTLSGDTITGNTADSNSNVNDGGYGIRIWTGTGTLTDNTAEGNAVAAYDISSGWTQSGNTDAVAAAIPSSIPEPGSAAIWLLALCRLLPRRWTRSSPAHTH